MAGAAMKMGDGIPDRIFLKVSDVGLPGRVGKHLEHI
jgi:hypothetical protein